MPFRKLTYLLICVFLMVSCSVNKFIPEGGHLLKDIKVVSNTNSSNAKKARDYVRQQPNAKWFSLVKVPLYTYALSGRDTTLWINRVLRRLGEAPVIYDEALTERSRQNIRQMLVNDGYLHASVDVECEKNDKKKRAVATYYLHERERYYVSEISLNTEDSVVKSIIDSSAVLSHLHPGMPFSVDGLEKERSRLVKLLRNKGYYRFQKDYITFTADTARYSNKVKLSMNVAMYTTNAGAEEVPHSPYRIGNVCFIAGTGMKFDDETLSGCDTLNYRDYSFIYDENTIVRPRVLVENTFIQPGELYSQSKVDRTYNSFSQLTALKYTTIRLVERTDTALLDCYILYERNKRRSVGFEIEGTNTAGDLGAATSITFSDKNLFRGSELLSLRIFGAYEAISNLSGYSGDSYFEYGAELSLRLLGGLPQVFLPADKRMLMSSTLFSLKFNSQERPEFERRILSGSWSYMWSKNKYTNNKLDIIDLNYIFVPWISETFKKEYLDSVSNRNSILKYNYENLMITKLGYTYSFNSSHNDANRFERVVYSLRANVETSGNLLYGINNLFGGKVNEEGQYTFLSIAYAQYVKSDFDFAARINMDDRNSIVLHVGLGVAYPYGNSRVLPFEKRYFSGGANGMRGWTVRSLGPGRYKTKDWNIDFINQSGDVKLDLNIEYRTHLFWKIHSAVFLDAGNIWTIRNYVEQPGGQFKFTSFYKELGLSYGLGFRFDFGLFIFRLDAAMKAINPAYDGKERFPIICPRFGRDFALHFAIGYPF